MVTSVTALYCCFVENKGAYSAQRKARMAVNVPLPVTIMRLLVRSVLLLLLLVSIPAAVQADTVTLNLVNTLPNNSAGGVYVYPYNFSINGSTTLTALLCDDYNHEVQLGESWYANVNTLAAAAAGAGLFGATTNYYQAAWLFEQLVNNSPYASPESINWAIWKIMSPGITVPSSVMGSASTQGSVAWWLDHIPATIDPNALSNIVVYTWDGNANTIVNGPGGPPQEYFGTRSGAREHGPDADRLRRDLPSPTPSCRHFVEHFGYASLNVTGVNSRWRKLQILHRARCRSDNGPLRQATFRAREI